MSYKLEIKAFFFNAKTDYLPYYKKFNISISKEATSKTLLEKIKEQDENFSYPVDKLFFRVNGLVVDIKEPILNIIKKLGKTLQIDPLSSYHSINGLILNDESFEESFKLLEPFASTSDRNYYETLYPLHFSSETFLFEKNYIGDAILILAHKMISENLEYKDEILDVISLNENGLFSCEYENNCFNPQYHLASIEALKSMVSPTKTSKLKELKYRLFSKINDSSIDIENKNIAYYAGKEVDNSNIIKELIEENNAKLISFSKACKKSGFLLMAKNPSLGLKKAGATLLDALDSGAEIFMVSDEKVLRMFKENLKAIECSVGRDIGLELVSSKELLTQVLQKKYNI